MDDKVVLLVEDNEDDVELTLRSFKKHNLSNKIVVARNGQEALDYLFAKGAYANRDSDALPVLILLDLKLPKVDGIEVLRQIRTTPAINLRAFASYAEARRAATASSTIAASVP